MRNKKSNKVKRLIISCLSFSLLLSGCTGSPYIKDVYYHPKFKTDYTIEEHIERISALTEENFSKELASGELVSYKVEIVYAYDEDPEYFLIELEYAQAWDKEYYDSYDVEYVRYSTRYRHLIGYIRSDKYWSLEGFKEGRSSYLYYGYADNKKYYNGDGVEAIEKDGQIITLFDAIRCIYGDGVGISPEFHMHKDGEDPCCIGEVIPEKCYQGMSECRLVLGRELYK